MFLHSGAGLHGHEYSSRSPQQPPATRSPLLRTALRPLAPSDPNASLRPDRPRSTPSLNGSPRPSSLSSRRPLSGSFAKKDLAVRFREPPMDDDQSAAAAELSDGTDVSSRRTRRKRPPRKATCFALAHPPSQLRTKQRMLQLRPRLLLQLQQVGDRRAIPAFDVVPSRVLPRMPKQFPCMFRAKPWLGQDDVLVVRSDDYGPSPGPGDASHGVGGRDVLAVISALPPRDNGCAEIVLEDGSTWAASPMGNGSFEFTHVDDEGRTTTARWVRRCPSWTRNSSSSFSPPTSPAGYKWTFSIIDPSSRRHPILGSLTSDLVQVYDTYNTLSSSSSRFPPTRSFSPEMNGNREAVSPPAGRKDERATVAVTEGQKRLMLATATWISLRQGGWPGGSTNPKLAPSPSLCRSASSGTTGRCQSLPAFGGGDEPSGRSAQHSWPQMQAAESRRDVPMPARTMSTGRALTKRRGGEADVGTAAESGPSWMPRCSSERQSKERRSKERQSMERQSMERQEEKAHGSVRRWMQKLFHRKQGPAREGALLGCRSDE